MIIKRLQLIDIDGNRVIDQQSATAHNFVARDPYFMMQLTENKGILPPPHCFLYKTNNTSLRKRSSHLFFPREEAKDRWDSSPIVVVDRNHFFTSPAPGVIDFAKHTGWQGGETCASADYCGGGGGSLPRHLREFISNSFLGKKGSLRQVTYNPTVEFKILLIRSCVQIPQNSPVSMCTCHWTHPGKLECASLNFLVFGLLYRHTASDSITSETHTSGAQ